MPTLSPPTELKREGDRISFKKAQGIVKYNLRIFGTDKPGDPIFETSSIRDLIKLDDDSRAIDLGDLKDQASNKVSLPPGKLRCEVKSLRSGDPMEESEPVIFDFELSEDDVERLSHTASPAESAETPSSDPAVLEKLGEVTEAIQESTRVTSDLPRTIGNTIVESLRPLINNLLQKPAWFSEKPAWVVPESNILANKVYRSLSTAMVIIALACTLLGGAVIVLMLKPQVSSDTHAKAHASRGLIERSDLPVSPAGTNTAPAVAVAQPFSALKQQRILGNGNVTVNVNGNVSISGTPGDVEMEITHTSIKGIIAPTSDTARLVYAPSQFHPSEGLPHFELPLIIMPGQPVRVVKDAGWTMRTMPAPSEVKIIVDGDLYDRAECLLPESCEVSFELQSWCKQQSKVDVIFDRIRSQ